MVSDVWQALEKRAHEEGIRLDRELQCDLPFILGDSKAFHSCVLNNLVSNGMAAYGEESVDKKVKVRAFVEGGGSLVVEVTDTGRGIAPQVQDSIFQPLFTTKGLEEPAWAGHHAKNGTGNGRRRGLSLHGRPWHHLHP